jgi:hypothetical protein
MVITDLATDGLACASTTIIWALGCRLAAILVESEG